MEWISLPKKPKPGGKKKGLIDLLDVFGYGLQVWNFDLVDQNEINEFLSLRLAKWKRGVEVAQA